MKNKVDFSRFKKISMKEFIINYVLPYLYDINYQSESELKDLESKINKMNHYDLDELINDAGIMRVSNNSITQEMLLKGEVILVCASEGYGGRSNQVIAYARPPLVLGNKYSVALNSEEINYRTCDLPTSEEIRARKRIRKNRRR